MPCARIELEERERRSLASYAQFSADTRGRVHEEEPPEWRTHYQRDRDRVIHSRAFRRLEYKTQVFLNGTGDHFRTRLTHTIEVAGISRNIARALNLNEDLAEAIALAHDLGHSCFGHRGEAILNRLMKDHGGFEHNKQSLRIVEDIEQKYPRFSGLNLTWEVREGLVKHSTAYDHPSKRLDFDAKSSSLEAQVANLADEVAYYSHDLDDGLDASLLDEAHLSKHVRIWREASRAVAKQCGANLPNESRRYYTIRNIIDDQVRDIVMTTEENLRKAGVKTADDVRLRARALVRYSSERRDLNLQLREYLYKNLYYNPEVHGPNLKAGKMLEDLFRYYRQHPDEIGEFSRRRAGSIGWPRAICDYLSGMTDRYAIDDHKRLFGS
jgi:dGTPase